MLCKSHDYSGSRYGIWSGDQIAFVEIPDDAQVAVQDRQGGYHRDNGLKRFQNTGPVNRL